MKKIIFVIFISLFIICGCDLEHSTYKKDGISITMEKGMYKRDTSDNDLTLYVENNDFYFAAVLEKYSDLIYIDINEGTTIEKYIDQIFVQNGTIYDIKRLDNLYYFDYEDDIKEKDNPYYYQTYIFKSDKGFWTCTFGTLLDNKDKFNNIFKDYAKTIKFK